MTTQKLATSTGTKICEHAGSDKGVTIAAAQTGIVATLSHFSLNDSVLTLLRFEVKSQAGSFATSAIAQQVVATQINHDVIHLIMEAIEEAEAVGGIEPNSLLTKCEEDMRVGDFYGVCDGVISSRVNNMGFWFLYGTVTGMMPNLSAEALKIPAPRLESVRESLQGFFGRTTWSTYD